MNVELRRKACVSIVGSACAPTTGRLCKVTAMSPPETWRRDAAWWPAGSFVRRTLRPGAPASASLGRCPWRSLLDGIDTEVNQEGSNSSFNVVSYGSYPFYVLARRVFELPVDVANPWEHRACVATAHRDDDVG